MPRAPTAEGDPNTPIPGTRDACLGEERTMPNNCLYSFADLFEAAFERKPDRTELASLNGLSQTERNRLVSVWAARAEWLTKDVRGTDGVVYTSFWPKDGTPCE